MNNKKSSWHLALVMGCMLGLITPSMSENLSQELSIRDAIDMAKANDPWLEMSKYTQSKLAATAIAAGQLNDPVVSVGLANIGADRFDFNQEPMTQLKVGFSQIFPRGKTRTIKTKQFNLLAQEQPILRENRLALLVKQVSLRWLDAYRAQRSIDLIEKDRPLFEQLVDLVEASYSSGFGQTQQQDLIRAQLELSRLDDRLSVLKQAYDKNLEQLKGLIHEYEYALKPLRNRAAYTLNNQLPDLAKHDALNLNSDDLLTALSKHPAMKAIDVRIEVQGKSVELAMQKYKPSWGMNASYGYRGGAADGISRADLVSIGVSFELPLFTKNKQDQEVKAAVFSVDSAESEKSLLLRDMAAMFQVTQAELVRLYERKKFYSASLLPQMSEQTEASLSAYTHDDGDFAEVVRARITELNAQIDALTINVDIEKLNAQINYLLTGVDVLKNASQLKGEKRS